MHLSTDELVLEIMAARSGTMLLAREVSQILRSVYNKEASSKSISKSLILLDEDNDFMNRRETTNKEKALYNCRYVYLFGYFDPITGEVA